MIWVLAGTGDSFELIDKLSEYEKDIIASVVTDYGKMKLADKNIKVIKKALKFNEMKAVIAEYNIELIIDATHPFAEEVSRNAMSASAKMEINYIRYERESIDLTGYSSEYIISVQSYQKAAQEAAKYQKIFLTIGSNNLHHFTNKIEQWSQRLVARILPDWKFIKKAEGIGFKPNNLIALQGPFSYELNKVLLKEYEADVIVSKASGNIGGLNTKIAAAVDLSIPIIIIRRPKLDYPIIFNDFNKLLNYCFSREETSNEK